MKKILIILPTLSIGGMERVLVNLVNSLNPEKYDIEIKTIYDNFEIGEDLRSHIKFSSFYKGSKRKKINYWKIRLYTYILKKAPAKMLYKLLIKEKYDVEIAFFRGAPVKIISGSNNKKSIKLAWVHNDFTKCNGIYDWFNNKEETVKAYLKYNKIVCVSESTKNSFIREININKNIVVKYNVNLCEKILSFSQEPIDDLPLKSKFRICTVGRLVKAKGYDRLLKVHKKLIQEFNYELIIVGDGPEKEKLLEYVEENNLQNSVFLVGSSKNPYKYIASADLFVCSSRWEGFSTVVSEAVILHTPIVSTRVSGIEELFLENEYGLITENTADSLYLGLREILVNKSLYNFYKEKVKERSEFFNTITAINNIEQLFYK